MAGKGSKLNQEIGYVKPRDIIQEMTESYIDYAMSVIISRALPDVRDGLKPVQRRILYAMYEDGLTSGAKFRKSANVVGSTLGRYHPHGDMAVYEALARIAQDFSLRYPLIKGQGNFGSIDGDPPAAQRYTECKLSRPGETMLRDIEKDTVDFIDNYDATRKEPVVLPSPLPQLLLNGCLGIAVGMATSIPPHNLKEVIAACLYLMDHPKADTVDIFKFIKGPDFPTGGIIFNQKGIIAAYSQGSGPILMRGACEVIENEKKKGEQIVISEIPFQVDKSSLVEQMANLVKEKKIEGIRDIRDESDKEGLRIAIDLQRGVVAQRVLNQLYKFTDLQKTFYLNMVALAGGIQPKIMSLPEVLQYFIDHRQEVIFRRTKYDLEKAKANAHILEGLNKCLSKIDAVIKTIKGSADRAEAQKNLIRKFKLTIIQANAILETKLQALAKLERKKIEEELKILERKIKEFTVILKNPQNVKEVVRQGLREIGAEFGDERRTKIYLQDVGEMAEEDLIPDEETIITLTRGGYIKRINPIAYKKQKRGGRGIVGIKTIGEDIVEHFLLARTHDRLLFFTDSGKVFGMRVFELPEEARLAKGRGLLNFLELSSQDKVLSIIAVGKEIQDLGAKYLVMITKNGIIKKTELSELENIRKSGLIAINLKKGDSLKEVGETTGRDEIMLATRRGQSIRFNEGMVRVMGRQASGIKAIRLAKGDEVVDMEIISQIKDQKDKAEKLLMIVTENGFGKRTALREYRIQGRGGVGIKTAKVTPKTGGISSVILLDESAQDLIVISQKGQVIRTKVASVPKLSRSTQGVRIMRLSEGDKIASATVI